MAELADLFLGDTVHNRQYAMKTSTDWPNIKEEEALWRARSHGFRAQ